MSIGQVNWTEQWDKLGQSEWDVQWMFHGCPLDRQDNPKWTKDFDGKLKT